MNTIDDKGIELMSVLCENGRTSKRHLASSIQLSKTPTVARVKRLEKEGYITGYAALVDEAKLGGSQIIFLQVVLSEQSQGNIREFERLMTESAKVMDCYMISGYADYLLRVTVDNMQELKSFLTETLAPLDHVSVSNSSFVMRTVARKSAPPLIQSISAG